MQADPNASAMLEAASYAVQTIRPHAARVYSA